MKTKPKEQRLKDDSPERKLASNIIGTLLEFEKYSYVSHTLIASVVCETIAELRDSGMFTKL
jgi:hypothetical protein